MTWLERHEVLLVTVFLATLIVGFGLAGLAVAFKDKNATAITAAIGSTISGLTGVKMGSAFIAASPNSNYGSGNSAAASPAPPSPATPMTPPPGGAH